MAKLFNRAKMTTSTTGTGTITLGSAATGFQSFADAGVANSDVVQYVIEEGANFEIGTGTYTSSGTTLSRTPTESSNSDNAISLAGNATVSITAVAADMNRLQHNGSDKVTVSSTGASVTGNISVTGTVDGRDIATDGSKLDGIEASADVTDATNVQAAGALMDSEVTNLAQVKAFDSSDYATAAQGTKADNALPKAGGTMTGAITFASGQQFDGRDVSADGSKLDGIASGAQVNVPTNLGSGTAASSVSIISSTGSNTSINAATTSAAGVMSSADKTKLDGIESGATADQTITAGSGLTGGGTGNVTISHADTSSQASVNNSGRTYIQDITLDTYGHITGITSATETVTNTNTNQLTTFQLEDGDGTEVTISHGKEVKFVEGGGIDINWTDTSTGSDGDPYDLTFTHADTSSQASVNNSGRTYIQDITLDGYGHVTAISSATETVTDTNTTYSAGGNYGIALSGTEIRLKDDRRRQSSTVDVQSGNTHDYTFYDADVGIRWYTAGAEEMRLENDGDLHVDGNVTAYSTTVSDERLKTDIERIDGALDKVCALSGYTFTYKHDGKASAGVVAQEVEQVLPSAVIEKELAFQGEAGQEYKIVQYDQLHGLLIEAIKELKAEIDELKAKLGDK